MCFFFITDVIGAVVGDADVSSPFGYANYRTVAISFRHYKKNKNKDVKMFFFLIV